MKMQWYKLNLKYNPERAVKWRWMHYDEQERGMVCTYCKCFGQPPVVAGGTRVSHPINNWVKGTELLNKQSEWHLASVEAQALADSLRKSGDVERMVAASEMDGKRTR